MSPDNERPEPTPTTPLSTSQGPSVRQPGHPDQPNPEKSSGARTEDSDQVAGPQGTSVQVREPRTEWLVQVWDTDAWWAVAAPYSETDRPAAIARLHQRQQRFPESEHRLIRRTTTYTLEEPTP